MKSMILGALGVFYNCFVFDYFDECDVRDVFNSKYLYIREVGDVLDDYSLRDVQYAMPMMPVMFLMFVEF